MAEFKFKLLTKKKKNKENTPSYRELHKCDMVVTIIIIIHIYFSFFFFDITIQSNWLYI